MSSYICNLYAYKQVSTQFLNPQSLSKKKINKTKSNQPLSHPGHLLISNSKSDRKTDGGAIAFPQVSRKQDIGLFDKLREKLTTHLSTDFQQTRTVMEVSTTKDLLFELCILLGVENSSRSQEDGRT